MNYTSKTVWSWKELCTWYNFWLLSIISYFSYYKKLQQALVLPALNNSAPNTSSSLGHVRNNKLCTFTESRQSSDSLLLKDYTLIIKASILGKHMARILERTVFIFVCCCSCMCLQFQIIAFVIQVIICFNLMRNLFSYRTFPLSR
jgi:hypothetical protein